MPKGRRGKLALITAMCMFAIALVSGSVTVALAGRGHGDVKIAKASLPQSLFSVEPAEQRIAKVDSSIAAEASPTTASPSPARSTPTTVSTTKPSPATSSPISTSQSPSPSARSALAITLSAKAKGGGNAKTLTYDSVVTNSGDTNLGGIQFTSHVPEGTSWAPDAKCSGTGHLVTVTYASGARDYCVGGDQTVAGSSDPTTHQVVVPIEGQLASGSAITVSWTVSVPNATAEVTNHAHASSGAIAADSPAVTTRMR